MGSTQFTPQRKNVLLVNDQPDSLSLVSELLRERYHVQIANSGERAFKVINSDQPPHLILIDAAISGMSSTDLYASLKDNPSINGIPVIFLAGGQSTSEETKALDMGAVDIIGKPVDPQILLARVAAQLKIKAAADFIRDKTTALEAEVKQRIHELSAIQEVAILAMASLAQSRDHETGNHILRTQHYVKELASHLREHPRFSHVLNEQTIENLYRSAPLHDIGKVGIPDSILLKPGRLSVEEFEIMKSHAKLGRDAIERVEKQLNVKVEFLQLAKEIAYRHHEKWDGSGYPDGIGGDDIPISARLMAVADVYDALISRRVYKDGMPHKAAVEIIMMGRGRHFDPDIADAFFALSEKFRVIAERYADDAEEMTESADRSKLKEGSFSTTNQP